MLQTSSATTVKPSYNTQEGHTGTMSPVESGMEPGVTEKTPYYKFAKIMKAKGPKNGKLPFSY